MNTYDVFERNKNQLKHVASVDAADLSAAAEKIPNHWPCVLKADHLQPYQQVNVERDGTLHFIRKPEDEHMKL